MPGPCPGSVPHAASLSPATLAEAALAALWVAAPFAGAGTTAWAGGWVYLGLLLAGLAAHYTFVRERQPELRGRRGRIGAGTPAWDVGWVAAFWLSMLAAPLVAGLDVVRLGNPRLPLWLAAAGAALLACGLGLSAAAMAVNPWFEGTVRLQPGQRVVAAGPYARVRHPGHAGLALWALATPLLLRSSWALAPAAFTVWWVVLRTALEDRLLVRGLEGYAEYAGRVRARLVPGIW